MKIVRAQKEVSKGRPRHLQNHVGVVTDPQVYCEVICDRVLNQILSQRIFIHAGPHT